MVELSDRLKAELLEVLKNEDLNRFPSELKPYLLYDAILFALSEPDPFYKEEIKKMILTSSYLNELLEKVTEMFFDDLVCIPDHQLLKNKNFKYISFEEFKKALRTIFNNFSDKKHLNLALKKIFTYSPKVYLLLYIDRVLNPGIISSIFRLRKGNKKIIRDLIKTIEKFNSFEEASLYFREKE